MKRLILLILIISANTIYGQFGARQLSLKKPISIDDEWHYKRTIQSLISNYGNSFLYFENLISGHYKFIKLNNSDYRLEVYDRNGKTINGFLFKMISDTLSSYLSIYDKTFENYIDNEKLQLNYQSKLYNLSTVIETNNILNDIRILNNPNISDDRILNKNLTRMYARDQYNNEADLFRLVEGAVILPYANGTRAKILCVDSDFHSVIFFDKDIYSNYNINLPVNGVYGSVGTDNGNFLCPDGITAGREIDNGNEIRYKTFTADRINGRISSVDFVIPVMTPGYSTFDNSTFSVVNNEHIYPPTDIKYFKHATDPTNDKLWISEAGYFLNSIVCMTTSGSIINKIRGFRYQNNEEYHTIYLESNMRIKLTVHDETFNALALIISNDVFNDIISFNLKADGTPLSMHNDSVVNCFREHFNDNYKLTSIHFQKTTTQSQLYPYLWVTSGGYSEPPTLSVSMIHGFAVNKFGGFAYLGSTTMPRNSLSSFNNLLNLTLINNYYDIFTIEEWNNSYGIRQYYPFVDLHSESVTDYCTDGINRMNWSAVFTNDCNIRVRVERKETDGGWQPIEIKRVDGQPPLSSPYYVDIYRQKGWTSVTGEDPVDIQVKLPLKDYFLPGTQLKLKVKLFPDYILPDDRNSNHIYREYIVNITRNCITEPVGCPFLYVTNEEGDYQLDNNILHKNEFTQLATDILDRYKLQVSPKINNDVIELYLTENENDISSFDQIKLYAVDFPENNVLSVTESNDLVTFNPNSVIASDLATYNNSTLITNNVNYYNPGQPVEGFQNDNIFAHFPTPDIKKVDRNNNLNYENKLENRGIEINGFIAYLGNLSFPTPGIKNKAGVLTATSVSNNVITTDFSRREIPSLLALPLFDVSDNIDNVNIDWSSDFRIHYIGVAPLSFNTHNLNDIPLSYAANITSTSENEITLSVLGLDNVYGEINEDQIMKLLFDVSSLPKLPPGYKREYVIEATGHYTVGTEEDKKLSNNVPKIFQLSQNFPNPFNPKTLIKYAIPKDVNVSIKIYDILGREVKTLVNEFKKTGYYQIDFDGSNYASGVYFYRIEAGNFVQSKKMVLVK